MNDGPPPWICCQLGAREHYSVPRALRQLDRLTIFVTDAWCRPANPIGSLKRGLRERFQPSLANANVRHFSLRLILFETAARARRLRGWPLILARNEWFQRQVVRVLSQIQFPYPGADSQKSESHAPPAVFAYSYAARNIFRFAKGRGWKTVLGQIDPGPPEERIVARLQDSVGNEGECNQSHRWQPAPDIYWKRWREECSYADRIVVNSSWSYRALTSEGIPNDKLRVIPLAYEPPEAADKFKRDYPGGFTPDRRLRVLFLGQVNLRKGLAPMFDVMRELKNDPVEFWIVGPIQLEIPPDLRANRHLRWVGPVSRGEATRFFQEADVFLFPTFSDGFGLTQLEAQAFRLPMIVSRYCGDVVTDGHNGWVLSEITGKAISAALRQCLTEPSRLRDFSANAVPQSQFGIETLGKQLLQVFG